MLKKIKDADKHYASHIKVLEKKGKDGKIGPGRTREVLINNPSKRIYVCHHNAFPYVTGVLQISKILESLQKLQWH